MDLDDINWDDFRSEVISQVMYPVSMRRLPNQKRCWCLLDFDVDEEACCPQIEIKGVRMSYRVVKKFESKEEAEEYAKKKGATFV